MRVFGSLLLMIMIMTHNLYAQDMEAIREGFKNASSSELKSDSFLELTERAYQETKTPLMQGYYGVALAVNASFANNIFSKIGDFNKGKKQIDKAISKAKDNIELRMIRLSVQANAPKIAGYYKNIDEDKSFLLSHIDKVEDKELKQFIKGFMENTDVF
ncbi:hypothetical protein [Aquimarina brevivitae]|uniref:DUF4375 domain-containing protein n=1 Tax=Aquimarina brevivitae TaxID=323412 RepID=A0A4Q7NU93_9FLAO|nr:hypothetical protein [Aquimarina brevivitae]RZS90761.1 hypothetical protein EV197_3292 [Aquimarina brevivitae]